MPFVTEELWQRLPRRADQAELQSIMLAPYPREEPSWRDDKVFWHVILTGSGSCASCHVHAPSRHSCGCWHALAVTSCLNPTPRLDFTTGSLLAILGTALVVYKG